MKAKLLLIIVIAAFIFVSCVPYYPVDAACLQGKTYGFWGGLWHGIIAPIDFIVMLFDKNKTVFAQNNNGAWYTFGFLLGSGGWGLLGANKASRKCK
jgi:hypothetical protein